ncbi:MAG: hypothetical protein ACJAZO_003162 [Myxococcota bacterium]|jgi:hypothetical protein
MRAVVVDTPEAPENLERVEPLFERVLVIDTRPFTGVVE